MSRSLQQSLVEEEKFGMAEEGDETVFNFTPAEDNRMSLSVVNDSSSAVAELRNSE